MRTIHPLAAPTPPLAPGPPAYGGRPVVAVIDLVPFRKDVLVLRASWTGD